MKVLNATIPDDIKYLLDQATIEIEHTRSWPTKVLTFYASIIVGIIAMHVTLSITKSNANCYPTLISY